MMTGKSRMQLKWIRKRSRLSYQAEGSPHAYKHHANFSLSKKAAVSLQKPVS
jgi:hypothetical protein